MTSKGDLAVEESGVLPETNSRPTTALPWKWGWNGDTCAVWGAAIVLSGGELTAHGVKRGKEANASYIVHACNAYPRLVAALKHFCGRVERGEVYSRRTYGLYKDLLRELGELEPPAHAQTPSQENARTE